jgi:hypothetical protein
MYDRHLCYIFVYTKHRTNYLQHLTCAFLFGADDTVLNRIYEVDSKPLEPWKDAPGEVIGNDWMDYLGKKEFVLPLDLYLYSTKSDNRQI